MRNGILIIDPQNDFVHPSGSLFIEGALEAIAAITRYIDLERPNLCSAWITQDSHYHDHIGHPEYWKINSDYVNKFGVFKEIKCKDVETGKILPVIDTRLGHTIKYLESLEKKGNTHRIWPLHCIYGSWGWAIPSELIGTLCCKDLKYRLHQKGLYWGAEKYSAFEYADSCRTEATDMKLLEELGKLDEIVVTGFAKNYCVAETLRSMVGIGKIPAERIKILDQGCPAIGELGEEDIKFFSQFEVVRV